MRPKHLIPGLALALAVAPAATAAKPPKPPNNPPAQGAATLTLDAKPAPIVFSSPTTLSGQLSSKAAGVTVRLEQDTTRPYGDSYKPANLTTTTMGGGGYSFSVKPPVNTQYRVSTQGGGSSVTSPAKLVLVRMLVGLRLSDSTPTRGSLVRFSGSVFPAHDGRTAVIQKRSSTGRFVTVDRTTLRDAGTARSTYSRRVKVRSGVYRVKVVGDDDHINGISRSRTITVGG